MSTTFGSAARRTFFRWDAVGRSSRGYSVLGLIAAGYGCGGDVTVGPRPEPSVETVVVSPSGAVMLPGDTVRFKAEAFDADAKPLPGLLFTWSTEPGSVASVDASGLVTGLAVGTAMVKATTGGRQGERALEVVAPAPVTPTVSDLDPRSIQAGWSDFTLTVHGDGFVPQSRVLWNGVPLETFHVDASELRATVSASYVTREGEAEIRVDTPAPDPRTSEPSVFTVYSRPATDVESTIPGNAVFLGDRVRLSAIARDQFGDEIQDKTITWTTSDSTVARIEGEHLRGLKVGSVQLTAEAIPTSRSWTFAVVESPVAGVVYEAAPTFEWEIFSRGLDPVAGARRILPAVTRSRQPSVSRDAQWIGFVGRDESDNADIYLTDFLGTTPTRLTSHVAIDDQPAWSPDGLSIAFRSFRDGKSDIWVMNADGSEPRNLTFASVFVPEEYNERPAWAPDGQTLVFSRGFGITQSLFTVGVDGSGMTELLARPGSDLLEPSWSDDGAVIAFRAHERASGRSTIEFVSSATAEPIYYAQNPPIGSRTPSFLPDGWLVMSALVVPGSTLRNVAFVRPGWGHVVVPMGEELGLLAEPSAVRR